MSDDAVTTARLAGDELKLACRRLAELDGTMPEWARPILDQQDDCLRLCLAFGHALAAKDKAA